MVGGRPMPGTWPPVLMFLAGGFGQESWKLRAFCRIGGIGRHASLRSWCPQGRVGSSPAFGTAIQKLLDIPGEFALILTSLGEILGESSRIFASRRSDVVVSRSRLMSVVADSPPSSRRVRLTREANRMTTGEDRDQRGTATRL